MAPSLERTRTSRTHAVLDPKARLVLRLREVGDGSLLRGWRREFDPAGSQRVSYPLFCKVSARLGVVGEVFKLGPNRTSLTYADISPEDGKLLDGFCQWVQATFDGPVPMFHALDHTKKDVVSSEVFKEGCRTHGYPGEDEAIVDIYKGCDMEDKGYVTRDELVFLQADSDLRDMQLLELKLSAKERHERLLVNAYNEEKRSARPMTHRRAFRPWLAESYEWVPMLGAQRRKERAAGKTARAAAAKASFCNYLRRLYGHEVRAWRIGLDPEAAYIVTKEGLQKYCRTMDYPGDSSELWSALDFDCDEKIRLEEITPHAADCLASFQAWARDHHGSCAQIWDHPEVLSAAAAARARENWASEKKMLASAFIKGLKALNCPMILNPDWRKWLMFALDKHACGVIAREDLEWIDRWLAPEWLVAGPDKEAWDELCKAMIKQYRLVVRAFRICFDDEETNQVSYEEFKIGCERLKFNGSVAGAWRYLDQDFSQTVSLAEMDPESCEVLSSFRDWSEMHFGSVKQAFVAFDKDGGGTVSLKEMRSMCKQMNWNGDVRKFFACVDTDEREQEVGKRNILLDDVRFLDSWVVNPQLSEEELKDIEARAAGSNIQRTVASALPTLAKKPSVGRRQAAILDGLAKPRCWTPTQPQIKVERGGGRPETHPVRVANTYNCGMVLRPSKSRSTPSLQQPPWLKRLDDLCKEELARS